MSKLKKIVASTQAKLIVPQKLHAFRCSVCSFMIEGGGFYVFTDREIRNLKRSSPEALNGSFCPCRGDGCGGKLTYVGMYELKVLRIESAP